MTSEGFTYKLQDINYLGFLETQLRDLQGIAPGCSGTCEGCPLHSACLSGKKAHIWALTRKGEQLLARHERAVSQRLPVLQQM